MPYTPVELRHVRVGRALLGYKRAAVQDLLTELADNFETVWRERHELADRLESMEHELEQLRTREQALTQTLVVAEQAAARVREQAKREAEMIVAEAHGQARAVTRDAEGERQRLHAESRRIEALLRGALGMIEESAPSSEPAPAEPVGGWPEHEEPTEPEEEAAPAETPASEQPQLRKVSGGFDWIEQR
jgi:cell division initiation protein